CLRRADRERLAGAWLEVVPRLVYPLVLLVFVGGITAFLMVIVMPRLRRIFDDFGEPLPTVTVRLIDVSSDVSDHLAVAVLAIPAAMLLASVLIASPAVRWYVPLLGRLYRWEVQGLVLRMLGALVEVGRPAPEALGL